MKFVVPLLQQLTRFVTCKDTKAHEGDCSEYFGSSLSENVDSVLWP